MRWDKLLWIYWVLWMIHSWIVCLCVYSAFIGRRFFFHRLLLLALSLSLKFNQLISFEAVVKMRPMETASDPGFRLECFQCHCTATYSNRSIPLRCCFRCGSRTFIVTVRDLGLIQMLHLTHFSGNHHIFVNLNET